MSQSSSQVVQERAGRDQRAQRGIRAAGWCATSSATGALSLATLLIPLFGIISISAGIVAVVAGPIGLARLRRVEGPSRRWSELETPLERVSFKMARRARRQGMVGTGLGLLALVLHLLLWG